MGNASSRLRQILLRASRVAAVDGALVLRSAAGRRRDPRRAGDRQRRLRQPRAAQKPGQRRLGHRRRARLAGLRGDARNEPRARRDAGADRRLHRDGPDRRRLALLLRRARLPARRAQPPRPRRRDASGAGPTSTAGRSSSTPITGGLEGGPGIHLVFLDACRNNPLPAATAAGDGGRDGLARVGDAAGFLFAFATQPDNVAYDGVGRNSFFAQALLGHLNTPARTSPR